MIETQQLLRDYVENGSEAAFHEIVESYVNLTYSTAIRLVDNNSQAAEDVVQLVFTDLARKASSLPSNVQLGGWLYRHTCFTAANLMRGERRRLAREKEAVEMSLLENESTWNKVAPFIDAAIKELPEDDQQAIALRFFEQCDLRAIGRAFGVSDDAAQKRVSRAVEKLRDLVARRGATLTVAALGTLLASETVKAAPIGLAEKATGAALISAKSAAALPKLLSAKLALVTTALLMITVAPLVWVKISRASKTDGSVLADAPLASTNAPLASFVVTNPNSETMKRGNTEFQTAQTKVPALGSNTLRLQIVAADSGRPVPNVPVDEWIQAEDFSRKKVFGNRMGICDVELSPGIKRLELTTQIEGFADTRLCWRPESGDKIPTNYVVRLTRPVPIGGRVVGPDGEAIEGAKVSWHRLETTSLEVEDKVESHMARGVETVSGPDGRWHLERIAPEALVGYHGQASHPNYVSAMITDFLNGRNTAAAEEALKKETYVFHLGRTITIRGVVVDPDGKPVSNAKIVFGSRETIESKASAEGSFEIKGCVPGKNVLTAEVDGFAATTLQVDAQADSPQFTITLKPGKRLRLRVVDDVGNPVPKAYVLLNRFTLRNEPTATQTEFRKSTDAEGKLVWENAPDEEMDFDIMSAGHMRLNRYSVRPDGEQHVAVLAPTLVVHGTVRDATTAKPIQRFRMICGWPTFGFQRGEATWSSFDRDWLRFTDGQFRHVFNEALIGGTVNPGYVFKFEAEGYSSFVTRSIKPDERDVQFDIVLKPSESIMVKAVLPNGRPAAMADVGWVAANSRLKLVPGGFSRDFNQNGGYLRLTDADGRFRLPTEDDVSRVVVACADGYGESTIAELASTDTLQLVPWGRLEGAYISDGKPVIDRELTIGLQGGGNSTINYDFGARVKVDTEGRFVFPKLPPGKHQLIYFHRTQMGSSSVLTQEPLRDVEIHPGETTAVKLGEPGCSIRLRFDHPELLPFEGKEQMAWMVRLLHSMPTEWQDKTPSGQEAQKSFRRFHPLGDGSWTIDDVATGTYVVEVAWFKTGADKKQEKRVYAKADVTVPETPATGTIDLGQLEVKEMPLPENPAGAQ